MPLPLFRKHRKKQNSPTVLKKTNSNSKTNLRTGIRGKYRSETEELRLKNEILSLSDNHTDHEIMLKLGLPNSTFYRYKSKLYEDAKELWKQQYKESQQYRILHTINGINLALRTQKEIIQDKEVEPKTRLEACKNLVELEIEFLKLIGDMNENKTLAPELDPRPTTFPTIPDPNNPGKWLTDPAWIEDNIRKMTK